MGRVTVNTFFEKKQKGEKLSLLTAYDFTFGKIVDEAGIDAVLVGDSLAMVVQGLENTLPVTMDEMVYHAGLVSRAVNNAMVIGDMPFMSYQLSPSEAVKNAGRFLKEGGVQGIKIEGGTEILEQVKAIVSADIPVMAHIGLTPQSIYKMGGFKVQGRSEEAGKKLLDEARRMEDAGAFCIVLEAVPMDLAKQITEELEIPTIGIGAGMYCDGQILVLHDLLGLFDRFMPKFAKRYASLKDNALEAIKRYKEEVEQGVFPSEKESFK